MFFLISKFNVLLLITLANAITVELPCMTNEKHECLPNYILTDKPNISLGHSFANPYYSKRIENVVIYQNSGDPNQKKKMTSPNTAYIIEVDKKYAEKYPEQYLKCGNKCPIINETTSNDDQNEIHLTMNNQEFIELRSELDSGDEKSLNVKRLQLLPDINDTDITYWERIQPYLFTSVVKLFEEYDLEIKADSKLISEAKSIGKSSINIIKRKYMKKVFLSYTLSVVEHISMQLKKEEIYTQLFDYLKTIGLEPDEEDQYLQWNNLRYMSGDMGNNWLREIRAYDPLQYEPYWSYMIRCYKRNKSPIPRNIISLYFEWSLVDGFAEFPIAYSTLLLRLLFTHPANILPIVYFKDTKTTKDPASDLPLTNIGDTKNAKDPAGDLPLTNFGVTKKAKGPGYKLSH